MLSSDEVKKIAALARIKLSESEEESFGKDLSSILGYVEALNEVDTSVAQPTLNTTMASNIVREDEASEMDIKGASEIAAMIVRSAPEHENGFIKVRAVM